ncbi:hypothetical protein EXN66_Car005645 [Channa argus]|uniref:Uncharacterized protein n=1 Tax=Channa argus TaxID=215402 RepID=A0A6G1PIF0_CHAAH|nr:hypothetical protein EXN66_Car005645 [Channa argus]
MILMLFYSDSIVHIISPELTQFYRPLKSSLRKGVNCYLLILIPHLHCYLFNSSLSLLSLCLSRMVLSLFPPSFLLVYVF